MSKNGLLLLCAAVSFLVPILSVAVPIKYTYTGSNYDFVYDNTPPDGSYTAAMRFSGSLTLTDAIPPNTALQSPILQSSIQSFNFSDGRIGYKSSEEYGSETTAQFGFETDANGKITAWTVVLRRSLPEIFFSSSFVESQGGACSAQRSCEDFAYIDQWVPPTGDYQEDVAIARVPGTWTISPVAQADFINEISGNVSVSGSKIGTFQATIRYNLTDANGNQLPDDMTVRCNHGLQNNLLDCGNEVEIPSGNPDAYTIWAANPAHPEAANPMGPFGEATYTPRPEFADKYFVTLTTNISAAGTSTQTQLINDIVVINNLVEGGRDNVAIRTDDWEFFFLSSPDFLDSVLLQDALGDLPSADTPLGLINFDTGTAWRLATTMVGDQIAFMPEPTTISSLIVGLVGLAFLRGRRRIND